MSSKLTKVFLAGVCATALAIGAYAHSVVGVRYGEWNGKKFVVLTMSDGTYDIRTL